MVAIPKTTCAPRPVNHTLSEWIDTLFYLGHFLSQDYPDFEEDSLKALHSRIKGWDSPILTDAVYSYQGYNSGPRLKERVFGTLVRDGWLGYATKVSIGNRICMHRDRSPNWKFGNGRPRWAEKDVTFYWVGSTLGALNSSLYIEAAKWWSTVCGIAPEGASSSNSANVWGQGRSIDGGSGTLAWSGAPVNIYPMSQRIEQRYDTDDIRIYSDRQSAKEIAFHEIGHSLHFDGHTNDPNDIMYPSFSGPQGKIGQNEARYMEQAYGPPGTQPPPPPPPGDDPVVSWYMASVHQSGRIKTSPRFNPETWS